MKIVGKVENGRINIAVPASWPDGTRVELCYFDDEVRVSEKIGMDESEWRDDEEARADWIAWSKSWQPLEFTPEEEREMAEWNEKMRLFNIEAVRKQMGLPPAE